MEYDQRKISTGDYDMLVIDEFMAAYRYGLIPNEEAVQFLKDRPDNLEVVLTGRDPSDELWSWQIIFRRLRWYVL